MDVKHVAKLANLPLTKEEEQSFPNQMQQILGYVDQLQKIDTSTQVEVKPELINVSRDDQVVDCPPLVSGFIKTKAIFEDHE